MACTFAKGNPISWLKYTQCSTFVKLFGSIQMDCVISESSHDDVIKGNKIQVLRNYRKAFSYYRIIGKKIPIIIHL